MLLALRVEVTDTGGTRASSVQPGDGRRADRPAGATRRLRRHAGDPGDWAGGGYRVVRRDSDGRTRDAVPLRVVIADDQALVRTGFAMILDADGIDSSLLRPTATKPWLPFRSPPPRLVMDIQMPEPRRARSNADYLFVPDPDAAA